MLKREAKIDSENSMTSGYHFVRFLRDSGGASARTRVGHDLITVRSERQEYPLKIAVELAFCVSPQSLVTCLLAGTPIQTKQLSFRVPALRWCGMLVDFELIKRAQKGDGAAFNEIVLAYRKRILGTITRLIARPEDVEDVAQEVFLRLYFSLDQLREERSLNLGCTG